MGFIPEAIKRMFGVKNQALKPKAATVVEAATPVASAKTIVVTSEQPRWGTTYGNPYQGSSVYVPYEPFDSGKYELYKSKYCNQRNPQTGSYWTMWELAAELGITVQNALDMIAAAQTEYNNSYLPTTVSTPEAYVSSTPSDGSHPPIKAGGYDYVWVDGAYEIYVSPEERQKAIDDRKAAARAEYLSKPHGIGIDRLPNGAIYMGNNRYGLPSSSQQSVYNEAMRLWKSGSDPAKLTLILSRLTEPYVFDADKYPDLKMLVDYYVEKKSIVPYVLK